MGNLSGHASVPPPQYVWVAHTHKTQPIEQSGSHFAVSLFPSASLAGRDQPPNLLQTNDMHEEIITATLQITSKIFCFKTVKHSGNFQYSACLTSQQNTLRGKHRGPFFLQCTIIPFKCHNAEFPRPCCKTPPSPVWKGQQQHLRTTKVMQSHISLPHTHTFWFYSGILLQMENCHRGARQSLLSVIK